MSLEFTDFARFYEGSGMSEAEQREDFEVYACFMECLVRHFWQAEPLANSLGISFDSCTEAVLDQLESDCPLPTTFNAAAQESAGRKANP